MGGSKKSDLATRRNIARPDQTAETAVPSRSCLALAEVDGVRVQL